METVGTPRKTGRRARNSLTPREIISVAFEILESEGSEALTIRNLAGRLSCSSAALYSHFQNVEDLTNAMVKVAERRLSRQLREARRGEANAVEQLIRIAKAYWDFAVENPEIHRLIYRKTARTIAPAYRVYATTLRRGCRVGDIKVSLEEATSMGRTMFAWLYGLVTMELIGVMHVTGHDRRDLEAGLHHFRVLLSSLPGHTPATAG